MTSEKLKDLAKKVMVRHGYKDFIPDNFVFTTYVGDFNGRTKELHIKEHDTVEDAIAYDVKHNVKKRSAVRPIVYIDYKFGEYYMSVLGYDLGLVNAEGEYGDDNAEVDDSAIGMVYKNLCDGGLFNIESEELTKAINMEKLRAKI